MHLTKKELAAYMDHTLLKPEATGSDIDRVVQEAKERQTTLDNLITLSLKTATAS